MGVACGGSTGSDTPGGAGSSAGGSSSAGSNHGGSATAGTTSSAGKASGGSSSGGSVNVAGAGGAVIGNAGSASAGSGGTGVLNPDCPARAPMGVCTADDAGLKCEYDPNTGCLCYPSAPGSYTPCQKVNPGCVYQAPAPAPAEDAAAGGVSGKIALPPHQYCSCSGTNWTCTFGI